MVTDEKPPAVNLKTVAPGTPYGTPGCPSNAQPARTQAGQLAAAILTLAAAGQAVPDVLLDLLAEGVLAAPLPSLALAVQAGGEHRLSRAIELAEAVLRGEVEAGGMREAGGKRA